MPGASPPALGLPALSLGRATTAGDEKFGLFPKQDERSGVAELDGRDDRVLPRVPGRRAYIEWSVRYGELYRRMLGLLDRLDIQGRVEMSEAGGPGESAQREPDGEPISAWQDIDKSLAEYCAAKGMAGPAGVDESIALHLRAIGEWLDDLESQVRRGDSAGELEGA
jgi:hypothetical protein